MPFAGLIANGAFFHWAVFVVVFVWRVLYNLDTMCCCHRKNAGDGAQHEGGKENEHTVGYTIFDELCRYYFVVRFQKIFE